MAFWFHHFEIQMITHQPSFTCTACTALNLYVPKLFDILWCLKEISYVWITSVHLWSSPTAWCSDKSRGRLQHSISHTHSRDWRYEDGEARVAKILGWVPLISDTDIQSTCQPKQKPSDLSALESNEFLMNYSVRMLHRSKTLAIQVSTNSVEHPKGMDGDTSALEI